jgi:DNA-binding NarL/FixJ family response regulator
LIRVLIVDDIRLWRIGVRALLERQGDIAVIGETTGGGRALELVEQLAPDVILIDTRLPSAESLRVIEQIRERRPLCRLVLYSEAQDEPFVSAALDRGVSRYVTKDCQPEELVAAIHAVYDGGPLPEPAG